MKGLMKKGHQKLAPMGKNVVPSQRINHFNNITTMKITRIKTEMGAFCTPVSTELDTIVERMRSEKTKKDAEIIASMAMQLRLMAAQGIPTYHLTDADRLPCLLFSATFGLGGLSHPKTFTNLLLLNIPCPKGRSQVEDIKNKVSQLPYTVLAFAGVSGVSLKVVVRCAYGNDARPWENKHDNSLDTEKYLSFLRCCQQSAGEFYSITAKCKLAAMQPQLTNGCRMSHDPQLYYNPKAKPFPVICADDNVLKPYEGAKTDEDGTVMVVPDRSRIDRIRMEFQTCLSKALDEHPDDQEACMQALAYYCYVAGLEEEASVVRAKHSCSFHQLSEDLMRKIFRNAYKEPYKGAKPLTQMNEKERIVRFIEDFLARRYQLRYNVVKGVTEFRPNDMRFRDWKPMTDREMKSLVVEEMKEGGESWMNDIRIYIESAHIPEYNPIHEFLAGCGNWDGKRNYIEEYAKRLPTDYDQWPQYFHRWFLAMVAQALNINRDFGNSMIPMLIGEQGYKKTQFCNHILPYSMCEYYMKDIKMDNAEQVERVLGRMWLVNIDEYNAKTEREQAKIKRLLTEKDVQTRKMRSDQYTLKPRLCSFIATTNDPTPLSSGDGTRRFLCIKVTGAIDMDGRIPYQQMYAQAVAELKDRNCIYWFTSADEQQIQQHNSIFQQRLPIEEVLPSLFTPTDERRKENLWQVMDIQKTLRKHLKGSDVPNLKNLGLSLKRLRWPQGGIRGTRGYYLKPTETKLAKL